jgi:hypothetical protein
MGDEAKPLQNMSFDIVASAGLSPRWSSQVSSAIEENIHLRGNRAAALKCRQKRVAARDRSERSPANSGEYEITAQNG